MRGLVRGLDHPRRRRRTTAPNRREELSACLPPQDLLDLPSGVSMSTVSSLSRDQPAAAPAQMRLDRLSCDVRHGRAATCSFVSQPRIEVVREFYGSPFHGMPAYIPDLLSSRTRFESRSLWGTPPQVRTMKILVEVSGQWAPPRSLVGSRQCGCDATSRWVLQSEGAS